MRRILHTLLLACCGALLMAACRGTQSTPPPDGRLTIGIAFETLQTEFWVAAWSAFKSRGEEAGATLLQAVADGDANKQFEQVRSFISRRVNGIVIVPKDGKTVIPMIRAANAASIPVVLFNRPADATDARHTVVAPDNAAITRDTVAYLIDTARRAGTPVKAAVLLGDLSDVNAVGRRDGFEQAVTAAGGAVSVVARIPTEWNQEKALAGLQSAFQSEPGIGLIFSSSDFMFPSVRSVLTSAGRWKKAGEPGHVVVGGFDGDPTAYRLMTEGYVDATGVQDVFWEVDQSLKAILDASRGTPPAARIADPGFVITQPTLAQLEGRMWGALIAKPKS